MKFKIILSMAILLLASTSMFAVGFPVSRSTVETTTSMTITEDSADEAITSPAATKADKFTVALLLWLFLGGFAAHRWYLGSPVGWNILFILTLGGLGIWWIIDGIDIITEKYPGL